ncbi:concanavalin A-like lectin/glucanase domain-containing protein [Xylariomycetidae sp. FL0641]|nr:concanavalin A-like lectin/glucanase domain-containing protein [Xylariomycetidae sp. FL0641]
MFSKLVSTTAVVLATTQLAYAQTFAICDPTKESGCPADPAFGSGTVDIDFTQGASEFFDAASGTNLEYGDQGAVFTINKVGEAPTITSNKYIFFGKVEVVVQAAPSAGIVTSFVLQSDNLDEIDWEWIGSDDTQAQTNYFGKGDDSTFDRGGFSPVSNPATTMHTYAIDWTKDYVKWYIDGAMVRQLNYADAEGGSRFPQTPAQIKLGTWVAGGPDSPEGTVQWAGGYTDFSQAPFKAFYKSLKITDYSNGVDGATEYVWDEGSTGSYDSINVITGDGTTNNAAAGSSTSSSAESTPSATSAASSETETKTTATGSATNSVPTTMSTATMTSTGSSSTATGDATTDAGSETNDDSATVTKGAQESGTSDGPISSPVIEAGALKTSFSIGLASAGLIAAIFL